MSTARTCLASLALPSLLLTAMGMDARTTSAGSRCRLLPRSTGARAKLAAALVAPLVWAGCQADPNMQLVERELRLQDRRIFELEEHLADCHSVVAAYRREITTLRRRADSDRPVAAVDDAKLESDWDADRRLRPSPPSGPSLPAIDEGDGLPPPPRSNPSGGGVSFPQPAGDQESTDDDSEELPPPFPAGSAADVDQIGLRLLVRYHPSEDVPVEVQTLVEPQDADLQQVDAAGDVSLMIMAVEDGRDRELARWRFGSEEIPAHWQRSSLGTGPQFRLPWPGSPQPGLYRLWARLEGEDGRKHLGSVDFEIDGPTLAQRPAPPRARIARAPAASDRPEEHLEPQPATPSAPREADSGSRPADARLASNEVAWKPSVQAARLPRPRQAEAVPNMAATSQSPTPADKDERLVPWSPHRPTPATRAAIETADRGISEWSPYR